MRPNPNASALYPLLLLPDFRERVWGTRDLSILYSYQVTGIEPIGEVWLTGDQNRVANGPLAGQLLGDLCLEYKRDLVGDRAPAEGTFPLLMKFLFAQEKLSVQVHPDDDEARRHGLPNGKNECWYVVDAKPESRIALGLKPGVSRHQVEHAITAGGMEDLLNWRQVRSGEMYYVEAGTVHAIAPGAVLLETQQNSDTTYRLYDYGRGRPLHVTDGLNAMKEKTRAGLVEPRSSGQAVTLISSPYFAVERLVLKDPWGFRAADSERGLIDQKDLTARSVRKDDAGNTAARKNSVHCLVVIRGCGVLEAAGMQPVGFAKGQCVVAPASIEEFRVRPQWEVELLHAWLPPQGTPAPDAGEGFPFSQ